MNDQADIEKNDEAKNVLEVDVPMAKTEQVNEANFAPNQEETQIEEVEKPLAIVVYEMGFPQKSDVLRISLVR